MTFIEKWHRDIIWLLLVILATFSAIYIKDKWHSEVLAKQEQKIASLNTDYVKLQAAKNTADNVASNTYNLYQQEHAKLISALSKKPVVVSAPVTPNSTASVAPLPQLPDSPAPTTLTDCQQELANLQKDDSQCIDTVNNLQTEQVAANKLIDNQAQTIINVDTENTQLAKDVQTQTKRKKLWRDSALLEAGAILLHFLL